jgi:hypothetical protein
MTDLKPGRAGNDRSQNEFRAVIIITNPTLDRRILIRKEGEVKMPRLFPVETKRINTLVRVHADEILQECVLEKSSQVQEKSK